MAKKEELEEAREQAEKVKEETQRRNREALEAMSEGRGILRLEKPIHAMSMEIEELAYDFTELTGMDYVSSMDYDQNAIQAYKITYRQALALFARAAAHETEGVDARDILEQIGITDAAEGAQLAMLFFNASTRAGRLRISKR